MTTLLLNVLVVGPIVVWAIMLARGGRGGALSRRAVAVAAVGGRDLRDVETYTQDCALAAGLLMAHRGNADPAFLRRILRDAVTQIDSVQRATRLRRALGRPGGPVGRRFGTWPDFLLWLSGIVDAGVVARLIEWRGDDGIADLERMAARALERFRATVEDADESPLLALFEGELLRMGMLRPEDLEAAGAERVPLGVTPDDEPLRS